MPKIYNILMWNDSENGKFIAKFYFFRGKNGSKSIF
jgi:hypothetical protein